MRLRLRHRLSGSYYVVDTTARTVLADLRERGVISREDAPDAPLAQAVLASALEYADCFARAVPGTCTPDGTYLVRGPLTRAEQAALADGAEVPTERSALQLHLDFFDLDLDGRITLWENYRAWRGLGFSGFAAAVKTMFSALFFGGPTIDIRGAGLRRYASSGIFDANGGIDVERLAPYLAAFDREGGELGFEQVLELLAQSRRSGVVSRRQFRSLFAVCRRQNGGRKVITKSQFSGLFDGSLLWRAASTPGRSGRRADWLQPAS